MKRTKKLCLFAVMIIIVLGTATIASAETLATLQSKGVFQYDDNQDGTPEILIDGRQIENNKENIELLKNSYSNGRKTVADAITSRGATLEYTTDADGKPVYSDENITNGIISLLSVSDTDKTKIVNAISSKGVTASSSDTVSDLASKIKIINPRTNVSGWSNGTTVELGNCRNANGSYKANLSSTSLVVPPQGTYALACYTGGSDVNPTGTSYVYVYHDGSLYYSNAHGPQGWHGEFETGDWVNNTGADVTVTVSASTSYTFNQTGYGGCGIDLYFTVKQPNKPTLTINPNGGSYNDSTSVSSISVLKGTSYTLAVPTKEGYEFKGWAVAGNNASISGNTLTMGTSNTDVIALWSEPGGSDEAPAYTSTYNFSFPDYTSYGVVLYDKTASSSESELVLNANDIQSNTNSIKTLMQESYDFKSKITYLMEYYGMTVDKDTTDMNNQPIATFSNIASALSTAGDSAKQPIVDALVSRGISATTSETWDQLVTKIGQVN